MHDISLDDIRLFVAVVQSGSLTQASELTGVPVSRLSRRLTALENSLGTKLINRGKKGVSLHETGESFFAHAQTMLHYAQNAISSIDQNLQTPTGLLKISLPIDVVGLISPAIGEFLNQYPKVSLEIWRTQQKINMIQDGIDIAIRAGTIDNENVVAKTLTTLEFGVYASPDYLVKHGTPTTPNELYQHQTIAQMLSLPWLFSQKDHQISITPQPFVAVNDFILACELIAQGIGIGVLPDALAKHANLVPLLDDWRLPSTPLSVIYYKNRGGVATVRSFVDWLCQKFRHSQNWQIGV